VDREVAEAQPDQGVMVVQAEVVVSAAEDRLEILAPQALQVQTEGQDLPARTARSPRSRSKLRGKGRRPSTLAARSDFQ
jgi:predicted secreted protein